MGDSSAPSDSCSCLSGNGHMHLSSPLTTHLHTPLYLVSLVTECTAVSVSHTVTVPVLQGAGADMLLPVSAS